MEATCAAAVAGFRKLGSDGLMARVTVWCGEARVSSARGGASDDEAQDALRSWIRAGRGRRR